MEAILNTNDKTLKLLSGHLGESDVVLINKALDDAFKAGRESRQDEIDQLNSIMNSKLKLEREYAVAERKAGRKSMLKEVVEWVEEHSITDSWTGWQEQKEEWFKESNGL